MSRFFAFGCSFTSYEWPTWADIVLNDVPGLNWGRGGAGNPFIFESLVECMLTQTISKKDTVCVMWTNVTREDRYNNGEWRTPGNIHTTELKDNRHFNDTRGFYIRDLAVMYAAKKMLDQIGCRYYFTSMVPITHASQYDQVDRRDDISDILPSYKEVLDIVRPSVYESVFNGDWKSRELAKTSKGFIDLHPTPLLHIEYLKKDLPELYQLLSKETIEWARNIDKLLLDGKPYNHLWTQSIPNRW